MSTVIDSRAENRFELPIGGGDGNIAAAYYHIEEGAPVLIHTKVPFRHSGQGLGSQLARGVFDIARSRGDKLALRCSFMGRFYARHPKYSDTVSG